MVSGSTVIIHFSNYFPRHCPVRSRGCKCIFSVLRDFGVQEMSGGCECCSISAKRNLKTEAIKMCAIFWILRDI